MKATPGTFANVFWFGRERRFPFVEKGARAEKSNNRYVMHLVILYSLLAALVNALFNIGSKFLVAQSRLGALSATLLVQGLTGVIAIPLIIFTRVHWVPAAMPYILAVATISLIGFVLVMIAFSHEDASTVGPILGLKIIYLALLESFFGGFSLGIGVIIASVVSLAGIALVAQTDRWSLHARDLLRPGVAIAAIAALFFAVCDMFVKQALQAWGGNSWEVNLYVVAALSLLCLLAFPIFARVKREGALLTTRDANLATVRPALTLLIFCAGTTFVSQYLLFTAFAIGQQLTLTNILFNTRNLFVVLIMAVLVMGQGSTVERIGWRGYAFRTGGSVLMLIAILLALLLK